MLLSKLLRISPAEMKRLWDATLSLQQRVALLKCCILNLPYSTIPDSFDSVVDVLLKWMGKEDRLPMVRLFCDEVLTLPPSASTSMTSLNSKHAFQEDIHPDGVILLLVRFMNSVCGCECGIQPFDASLVHFVKEYAAELQQMDIPCNLLTCHFAALRTFNRSKQSEEALALITHSLQQLIQGECERLESQLAQMDCTNDLCSRILFCGQLWQVLLQLPSNSELMGREMASLLIKVDLNATYGGRIWCSFLQILLFSFNERTAPELTSLREVYALLSNRILSSHHLVLFDTPGLNDGFRYDLATSIRNSDLVLTFILPVRSRVMLKGHVTIEECKHITRSAKTWCERMPYRSVMSVALLRFAQSLLEYESSDPSYSQEGSSLLQGLMESPDPLGVSMCFLSSLCFQSERMKGAFSENRPTYMDHTFTMSSPLSLPLLRRGLLSLASDYGGCTKPVKMRILLFLEQYVGLEAGQSYAKRAISVLKDILYDDTSLIQSFTFSLIKKKWGESQFQAIFELSLDLAPSLPRLFSVSLACLLNGAQGSLSESQSRIAAFSLAETQLYSLETVSFTNPLRVLLPDTLSQKLVLAGILKQVLYQVD